jgi:hypothetical protein
MQEVIERVHAGKATELKGKARARATENTAIKIAWIDRTT